MSKKEKVERLDRNIRFFGGAGQKKLEAAHVIVVGLGGLGTHVVQQLAYLGVGALTFVDHENLDETNKNRYVSAYASDAVPGSRKVDLCERMVSRIAPEIKIQKIYDRLRSSAAFRAVTASDYVFGCVDNDGARLVLTELCSAYGRPYIDLATEIIPGARVLFGGRVCIAWDGEGCPVCLEQLDLRGAQKDLESEQAKRDRKDLYGVATTDLAGAAGPSVVSVNGVVASLGVTEFIVGVTGLRRPKRLLTYRGDLGRVTTNLDVPPADCYYCKEIRNIQDAADVQRYLRIPT